MIAILLLLFVVIPAGIIAATVYPLKARRPQPEGPHGIWRTPVSAMEPIQLAVAIMALMAAYTGIAALTVLPTWGFRLTDPNLVVGFRVVVGILILASGLMLRRFRATGTVLMAVGSIGLLFGVPYVFENIGSYGILALIGVALVVLIFLAVKFSHKDDVR